MTRPAPYRPTRLWTQYLATVLTIGLAWHAAPAEAADRFAALEAGGVTYRDVIVLSASESSLSIHHAGGLTQLPLSALPAELQVLYGYRPDVAASRELELKRQRIAQAEAAEARLSKLRRDREAAARSRASSGGSAQLEEVFGRFGQPASIEDEVDLREAFRRHSLAVRNQGPRPSCAIHSVVAALEYQHAEYKGTVIDVSENRLFEATQQLVGPLRALSLAPSGTEASAPASDAGFTLEEVFLSIRRFGLVMEEGAAARLSAEQSEALKAARFTPFRVPGADPAMTLENVLHLLNARMPVVVGLAWPADNAVRHTNLLAGQTPVEGAGHAITLVGYRSSTGQRDELRFIFRNSWGSRWGAGGYGFVTYEYLKKHAFACYVVELH